MTNSSRRFQRSCSWRGPRSSRLLDPDGFYNPLEEASPGGGGSQVTPPKEGPPLDAAARHPGESCPPAGLADLPRQREQPDAEPPDQHRPGPASRAGPVKGLAGRHTPGTRSPVDGTGRPSPRSVAHALDRPRTGSWLVGRGQWHSRLGSGGGSSRGAGGREPGQAPPSSPHRQPEVGRAESALAEPAGTGQPSRGLLHPSPAAGRSSGGLSGEGSSAMPGP
ncbi:translation initiation factor IF-2-like isoform X2 [Hemicordylus capensis]|uniref:translation initiation factor IF-2-like isoform X2 n=1 Tax=Hemicordylus capensis TaxID=884348 RepID=UPI0023029003|nr:translation initiation factor IF-2-like isoform X2 [Hemicordylus capensis]